MKLAIILGVIPSATAQIAGRAEQHEAWHPRFGVLSRRGLPILALLAAPLLQASPSLAKERPAPSQKLVRATLKDPQLWTPEFMVGEAIVGQFTATNPDQTSPQDGVVRLTLYDSENRIEGSTTTPVFVPIKGTLNSVFAGGPKPKSIGPKTLEFRSALNSVKVTLIAQPGVKPTPRKANMPSLPPEEKRCSGIVTTLGLCR